MNPKFTKAWPVGTILKEIPSAEAVAMLLGGAYFGNIKTGALQNIINNPARSYPVALLIEGDVHTDSHLLDLDSYREHSRCYSHIIITGKLTVEGTLYVGWNKEGAPLIVLGELIAHNLIVTETALMVQKDVTISGIALLLSEAYLMVNGKLSSRGYFAQESAIEVSGNKKPDGELEAADFIDELIYTDPDYEEDGIDIGIEYNRIEVAETIEAMYAGADCLLGKKRPPIDE